MNKGLPLADLNHVVGSLDAGLWDQLRGNRVFLTGGTGFFGKWLLESFHHANRELKLSAQVHVLTRDPARFLEGHAAVATWSDVVFYRGDVRDFPFPDGQFSHVIHAATEASAKLNAEDPIGMIDVITQGTRRVLEFARLAGARKFLLTSSGAVYGHQPFEMTHVPENYAGAPDLTDPRWAYGEGKRLAELFCAIYHRKYGLETKVARCFGFVGPHLPLDVHFAIGNFIRDALAGGPIKIGGDGTPYRSFLYAADLTLWLWKILFAGIPGRPYAVGSEDSYTIEETARAVARTFTPETRIEIAQQPKAGVRAERYVPQSSLTQKELSLPTPVPLAEALRRTVDWHQTQTDSRAENSK
jgi:nucleoside-diphosphate-sugar epimerase